MRTGVRRLVQVDHPVLQVLLQRSVQRRRAHRDRRVVRRPDVQLVVILYFKDELSAAAAKPPRRSEGLPKKAG